MELSHDDVLEILELIEHSKVEYLELEVGDTKIVVNKSGIAPARIIETQIAAPSAAPTQLQPSPASQPERVDHQTPASAPAAVATETSTSSESTSVKTQSQKQSGLIEVKSPVVGVFYRQSEPGAPPYVEIGSKVDAGTTIGLLEVMKMFTSVTAPVAGEIAEILVENNEFVEFDQTIMLIKPESAA